MKTIGRFFLLLIFVASSALSYGQSVGDPAPDFTLETLGGPDFRLSEHTGKVVFIFLFGYACPHCLSNGPNTQSGIYEVFKDSTEFVAVGVDTWDGNSDGVQSYQASTGIEYTLCLMGSELEQVYQTTYDRIVVVDKDGIIRYKSTANATTGVVDQARSVIETYLALEPMENDDDNDGEGDDNTVTSISSDVDMKGSFLLYPNPSSRYLHIEDYSLQNHDFVIKLFDRAGKILYEQELENFHDSKFSIPVHNLQDGLYYLTIYSDNQLVTKRFLVSN